MTDRNSGSKMGMLTAIFVPLIVVAALNELWPIFAVAVLVLLGAIGWMGFRWNRARLQGSTGE